MQRLSLLLKPCSTGVPGLVAIIAAIDDAHIYQSGRFAPHTCLIKANCSLFANRYSDRGPRVSVIFMESGAAAEWDAALVSVQTLAWVSAWAWRLALLLWVRLVLALPSLLLWTLASQSE